MLENYIGIKTHNFLVFNTILVEKHTIMISFHNKLTKTGSDEKTHKNSFKRT